MSAWGGRLNPSQRPCSFYDNISELEEANPDRQCTFPGSLTSRADCYYSLGERFFLNLYLALGETRLSGRHFVPST